MAGQGCLDCDLGRVPVANLTDENDVRRLTQHRPENRGKRQADLGAHLALVQAREVIFHRILGGDDLFVRAVQFLQRRVQRGGLSRPRRAGDQKHAVGAFDDLLEDLVILAAESESLHAATGRFGRENTQHHRLAVVARQCRDAEVDPFRVDKPLDAPVLGEALLGDVDSAHDLQTRDHRALHALGNRVPLQTNAVDPIPNANAVGHRLEVNVAGTGPHRLGDDQVDQPNDRRCVDILFFFQPAVFGTHDHVLGGGHRAGDIGRQRAEELVDHVPHFRAARQHGFDAAAHAKRQRVDGLEVQRIGDDDAQSPVFLAQRQDAALLDVALGDQTQAVGGDLDLVEVDILHVVLGGEGLGDVFLVNEAEVHQRLAHALA